LFARDVFFCVLVALLIRTGVFGQMPTDIPSHNGGIHMYRLAFRLFAFLACVGLLGFSARTAPSGARAAATDGYLSAEVVVKLVRAGDLAAVAADYALDPVPLNQFGSRPIYRLRITDQASPHDKAEALLADPQARIVYAEANLLGGVPERTGRVTWSVGGDSGDFAGQWAPSMIRLSEAHTVTRGAGITVAVLDTGVDAAHPALAGRLVSGYDFVDLDADPSEVGTHAQNPSFGHGTHVAGLIALVAPDAKIMPLRVLDQDGVGNSWVLAEALAYAMDPDGNPATNDGANVINLSLSTIERSKLVRDVIKAVICNDDSQNQSPDDLPCLSPSGRGAVVVAAAGNSASSTPEYPAGNGDGGSLAVGASTRIDSIAAFSNFGSWVRVSAPGESILSSVPGGGYGTWSGTSMATPLVAGEAALVRAVYPSLKPAKVVQRIIDKSVDIRGSVRYRIDAASAVGLGRAR
jgi:subtilisin family serine protease